ncbi:MAG: GNAT family N-acetyltransferase [Dehalococcoidia bacterium]|nr:GNAT family N-acetyltransferase [Dehalococcoidia bacterium]MDP6781980.1 GNAT family N-acetyltransferase [Dehalococcoidia bacterium]
MPGIELLGVDPAVQSKGVGKALVSHLLDYCRDMKLQRVTIIADRHDDIFRKFFTSMGFKEGDAIDYSLRLEQ